VHLCVRLSWQDKSLSRDRGRRSSDLPTRCSSADVASLLQLGGRTMASASAGAPCCSRPSPSLRITPQRAWPSWALHPPRYSRARKRAAMAIALPDSLPDSFSLDAVACSTQSLLDTLVGLSPGWLQPAESLIGSDVVSLLRLQVSAESVLRLGVRAPAVLHACALCGGHVPDLKPV